MTFLVMAVSLGVLFAVNSWDWPTYFGVAGGATLLALLLSRQTPLKAADYNQESSEEPVEQPEARLGTAGTWVLVFAGFLSVIAMGLLSLSAYLPFFLNFKAFYSKLMLNVDGGLIPGTTTVMHHTTLAEYLVVWAIFVFIAVSYLLYRLWNFPWSDALADLINLVPGGARIEARPTLAATQAFSLASRTLRRGFGRLELAPAYSGSGVPTAMAFISNGEEMPADVSATDPVRSG